MKLFKLTPKKSKALHGYDVWNGVIVCAPDSDNARMIHPNTDSSSPWESSSRSWVQRPEDVTAEYLGEARAGMSRGVVLASFVAG